MFVLLYSNINFIPVSGYNSRKEKRRRSWKIDVFS